MKGSWLDRDARWAAVTIHTVTGILFAVASGVIVWAVAGDRLWLLAIVIPVTLGAAWGWWVQARFFLGALRGRDIDLRLK